MTEPKTRFLCGTISNCHIGKPRISRAGNPYFCLKLTGIWEDTKEEFNGYLQGKYQPYVWENSPDPLTPEQLEEVDSLKFKGRVEVKEYPPVEPSTEPRVYLKAICIEERQEKVEFQPPKNPFLDAPLPF